VRVLALPGGKDPDSFIHAEGAAAYTKLLNEAPPYVDYLISRASKMDLTSVEGKLRAVNFLMPYVQRIPDRILRSEWATRIRATASLRRCLPRLLRHRFTQHRLLDAKLCAMRGAHSERKMRSGMRWT